MGNSTQDCKNSYEERKWRWCGKTKKWEGEQRPFKKDHRVTAHSRPIPLWCLTRFRMPCLPVGDRQLARLRRHLLKKQIAIFLVRKIPHILLKQNVNNHIGNSQPVESNLSQLNPAHILTSCLFKTQFILSSYMCLNLPTGFFFSCLQIRIHMHL
jgi:hypothetical protein